jgi:hypothetical protein
MPQRSFAFEKRLLPCPTPTRGQPRMRLYRVSRFGKADLLTIRLIDAGCKEIFLTWSLEPVWLRGRPRLRPACGSHIRAGQRGFRWAGPSSGCRRATARSQISGRTSRRHRRSRAPSTRARLSIARFAASVASPPKHGWTDALLLMTSIDGQAGKQHHRHGVGQAIADLPWHLRAGHGRRLPTYISRRRRPPRTRRSRQHESATSGPHCRAREPSPTG